LEIPVGNHRFGMLMFFAYVFCENQMIKNWFYRIVFFAYEFFFITSTIN